MGRDRAAYMRVYRARKRSFISGSVNPTEGEAVEFAGAPHDVIAQLSARILELAAEVARLKRELAARPAGSAFSTRPFTPVPKRGK